MFGHDTVISSAYFKTDFGDSSSPSYPDYKLKEISYITPFTFSCSSSEKETIFQCTLLGPISPTCTTWGIMIKIL